MRIAFVRPNMTPDRSDDAMEPLVFSILAGLTPPGHETVLYDDRIEDVPLDEPADLVAMSVETYTARRAYRLAREFRARGVPVVMGGYHPTLAPEEAGGHADSIVIGDAEEIWPRLVRDTEAGRLAPVYRQESPTSLEGLPVDRSVFAGKSYTRYPIVQFQRGCRYACEFCSIRAFYGSSLRSRPVSEVLEEIDSLGTRRFFLADDNGFNDEPAAIRFFEALAGAGCRWGGQFSVDIAKDDRTLDLLERSGCRAVLIGFESLDPANLAQLRKGWNLRHGDYATLVTRIRDRGMMIYGTFVFGSDHDTVDSFDLALEFALENDFFLANFNPLTPTPGTPLYDRLKREGRLIDDPWWLSDRYRYGSAHFHPKGMTPEELTEGCYRARSRFYRWSSIAKRALDRTSNARSFENLSLFVGANVLSRREVHRKQGRHLDGGVA